MQINRTALKKFSEFYKIQSSKPARSFCGRNDVEPYLPVVVRHEGLGLEANSRTLLYKQKLDALAGPAAEGLVAATVAGLATRSTAALQPVATAARANAALADTQFRISYCTFKYVL